MPDIFSYFSPKKLQLVSSPPRMVMTNEVPVDTQESDEFRSFEEENDAAEEIQKRNISEDEVDVAGILDEDFDDEEDVVGILNENYENYDHDYCSQSVEPSSVESLSIALLKLESEKASLDSEISNKYNTMTFAELEEMMERLISVSWVAFSGDSEEVEELTEIFDLMKSTAKFAKKRLRKIQENGEKKKLREFLLAREREQRCVSDSVEGLCGDPAATEEHIDIEMVEFMKKKSMLESEASDNDPNTDEEGETTGETMECNAKLSNDIDDEDIEFHDFGEDENQDCENQDTDNKRTKDYRFYLDSIRYGEFALPYDGGDTAGAPLEAENNGGSSIFSISDDIANSENAKSQKSVKSRFGQVKNRLSLRRVFKKKLTTSTSEDVM